MLCETGLGREDRLERMMGAADEDAAALALALEPCCSACSSSSLASAHGEGEEGKAGVGDAAAALLGARSGVTSGVDTSAFLFLLIARGVGAAAEAAGSEAAGALRGGRPLLPLTTVVKGCASAEATAELEDKRAGDNAGCAAGWGGAAAAAGSFAVCDARNLHWSPL